MPCTCSAPGLQPALSKASACCLQLVSAAALGIVSSPSGMAHGCIIGT